MSFKFSSIVKEGEDLAASVVLDVVKTGHWISEEEIKHHVPALVAAANALAAKVNDGAETKVPIRIDLEAKTEPQAATLLTVTAEVPPPAVPAEPEAETPSAEEPVVETPEPAAGTEAAPEPAVV